VQATIPYATGHRPEKDPALHIVEKFYGREAAGRTAAYGRSPESVTLIRIHCTINLWLKWKTILAIAFRIYESR
jgi:hypothetical protein